MCSAEVVYRGDRRSVINPLHVSQSLPITVCPSAINLTMYFTEEVHGQAAQSAGIAGYHCTARCVGRVLVSGEDTFNGSLVRASPRLDGGKVGFRTPGVSGVGSLETRDHYRCAPCFAGVPS